MSKAEETASAPASAPGPGPAPTPALGVAPSSFDMYTSKECYGPGSCISEYESKYPLLVKSGHPVSDANLECARAWALMTSTASRSVPGETTVHGKVSDSTWNGVIIVTRPPPGATTMIVIAIDNNGEYLDANGKSQCIFNSRTYITEKDKSDRVYHEATAVRDDYNGKIAKYYADMLSTQTTSTPGTATIHGVMSASTWNGAIVVDRPQLGATKDICIYITDQGERYTSRVLTYPTQEE